MRRGQRFALFAGNHLASPLARGRNSSSIGAVAQTQPEKQARQQHFARQKDGTANGDIGRR